MNLRKIKKNTRTDVECHITTYRHHFVRRNRIKTRISLTKVRKWWLIQESSPKKYLREIVKLLQGKIRIKKDSQKWYFSTNDTVYRKDVVNSITKNNNNNKIVSLYDYDTTN